MSDATQAEKHEGQNAEGRDDFHEFQILHRVIGSPREWPALIPTRLGTWSYGHAHPEMRRYRTYALGNAGAEAVIRKRLG